MPWTRSTGCASEIPVGHSAWTRSRGCNTTLSNYGLDQVHQTHVFGLDPKKHRPLSAESVKELRKRNLVEGRKNALIVAKSVAQATEQEAEYTRAIGFTDDFCMDLIEKAVQEHNNMTRAKFEELLFPYFSSNLTETQKSAKVGNLLTKMRKEGRVHPTKGKVWAPGSEK